MFRVWKNLSIKRQQRIFCNKSPPPSYIQIRKRGGKLSPTAPLDVRRCLPWNIPLIQGDRQPLKGWLLCLSSLRCEIWCQEIKSVNIKKILLLSALFLTGIFSPFILSFSHFLYSFLSSLSLSLPLKRALCLFYRYCKRTWSQWKETDVRGPLVVTCFNFQHLPAD